MKIEDVIKMVKYPALNRTAAEEAEAREVIIAALEKQIPKETTETQELIEIEYICPVCERVNDSRTNYCWFCGQRITDVITGYEVGTQR